MFAPAIGIRNVISSDESPFKFFPVLPDGTFEEDLIPGNFTLYIPDGNGGQPEYSSVMVVAGKISYPSKELLGHAATYSTKEDLSFRIVSGRYYERGMAGSADVTSILQARVVGGTLTITALPADKYNSIFAPAMIGSGFTPGSGAVRFLDITYKSGKSTISVSYPRNSAVNLP